MSATSDLESEIGSLESRKDMIDKIDSIRSSVARRALGEIMVTANDIVAASLEAMTEIVPEAVQTIHDVMRYGTRGDSVRLKAALEVLGIFGVSAKKKIEVTRKDGDILLKKDMMNEFQQEVDRHISNAQQRAAAGLPPGPSTPEILNKPS